MTLQGRIYGDAISFLYEVKRHCIVSSFPHPLIWHHERICHAIVMQRFMHKFNSFTIIIRCLSIHFWTRECMSYYNHDNIVHIVRITINVMN